MLKNPAYKGKAAFGKTRAGEFKPRRLRPQRGRPELPRRPVSTVDTPQEDHIFIDVPALVSEELFGVVQAQLEENRRRRRDRPGGGRYLLQGLACASGAATDATVSGRPGRRPGAGSRTPTTAAPARTPTASAASASVGTSRSGPICWTPPSGGSGKSPWRHPCGLVKIGRAPFTTEILAMQRTPK